MIVATRQYHYLYCKVRPFGRGGYYWETESTPKGMTLVIEETQFSKRLKVQSRFHVNKDVQVGPTYSLEFSDADILKDLSGEVYYRFII